MSYAELQDVEAGFRVLSDEERRRRAAPGGVIREAKPLPLPLRTHGAFHALLHNDALLGSADGAIVKGL